MSLCFSRVLVVVIKRSWDLFMHVPLARYVNLRVAHAPGMPGTFFPPPRVSNPDMHHDTCVTHVPWCRPGSLTCGFLWSRWGGNLPGIPGACTTRNFTYQVRGPWYLWLLHWHWVAGVSYVKLKDMGKMNSWNTTKACNKRRRPCIILGEYSQ